MANLNIEQLTKNKKAHMKKSIAWKTYFWPFVAFSIYSIYEDIFELQYDSVWQILDTFRHVLSDIGLIGAFGYIYNKKIFNNIFWKIYFWIALYDEIFAFSENIWNDVPLELTNPLSIEFFFEQKYYIFIDGFLIAIIFPFYLSIFLYAYRSKSIWIKQQQIEPYK